MSDKVRRQSDIPAPAGRHGDWNDSQALPRIITTLARDQPAGSYNEPHSHLRGQLLYASKGLMRVASDHGIWFIPPQRGLWIPAGIVHDQIMLTDTRMRTIYIERSHAERFGPRVKVIEVDALLRELILALVDQPVLYPEDTKNNSIVALILYKLENSRTIPLEIPWPQDRRLVAICQRIIESPEAARTIEHWSEVVGASSRTLIRGFIKETGITFRQWVQQVKLAHALTRLERGDPVKLVAEALGYASPSAFSSMFKRIIGETPTDYLARD